MQDSLQPAQQLAETFRTVLINPFLLFLFALGLLVFVWGVVEFLLSYNLPNFSDKKESGKRHMMWGIIGMFIMVSAYALVSVIQNTFPSPSPVENPDAGGLF